MSEKELPATRELLAVHKLSVLGEKWLEAKIQRMRNLLKIAEPDEALYREIMISLGYPKNKLQFLELSLMLPFREIRNLKKRDIIEKALLYRAGFIESQEDLPNNFDLSLRMDKSVWDFKRIRPANYPDKRIQGISYLLAESISCGIFYFFNQKILNVLDFSLVEQNSWAEPTPVRSELNHILAPKKAKIIVAKIMNFKGIGMERKREMFFNIILPFCLAYNENQNFKLVQFLEQIYESHPPLSENSTIKAFKFIIDKSKYSELIYSTKTYFGAQFYIKNYRNIAGR